MRKSALILALGIIVLSCTKKEAETQTGSDISSADTMTPGTVPVEPDTTSVTTIPSDSSSANSTDSIGRTR